MPVIDMVKIEKHYRGKWIALSEDQKRVIASGSSLEEALVKAKKKGAKNPIMSKVPREFLEYIL